MTIVRKRRAIKAVATYLTLELSNEPTLANFEERCLVRPHKGFSLFSLYYSPPNAVG